MHKREQEIKECQYVPDGVEPPFPLYQIKVGQLGHEFQRKLLWNPEILFRIRAAIPQLASSQKSQAENMQVFLSSENRAPSQRGARSAEDFFFFSAVPAPVPYFPFTLGERL